MDAPALGPRYQPLYRLAAGGMAEVWVGAQKVAAAQRPVAIKRILPQFAEDQKYVRMFLDEAHLAACIDSPNVVSLIDADVAEDGAPFLVMELVEGLSLSTLLRIKTHPMDEGTVCYVIKQAALGLHDAHEARAPSGEALQLVHRDVSPHNLLLGVDGRVRLADFGVAHALERMTLTVSGEFKGKLAYCAPEQLHGEVDRRADIFSLGIVARQAFTGEKLFGPSSSNAEAMRKLLNEEIRPTKEVAPQIGDALAAVIDKALRRDPDERYATAAEFADALTPFASASRQTLGKLVEAAGGVELRKRLDKTTEMFSALKAGKLAEPNPEDVGSAPSSPEPSIEIPLAVEAAPKSNSRLWIAVSLVLGLGALIGVGVAVRDTDSDEPVGETGGGHSEAPEETVPPAPAAPAVVVPAHAAPAVVVPASPDPGDDEQDEANEPSAASSMRSTRPEQVRSPPTEVAPMDEEPAQAVAEEISMSPTTEMQPSEASDEAVTTMRRTDRLRRDVF